MFWLRRRSFGSKGLKTFWLKEEDLSTRFFHSQASTRRKVDYVGTFKDSHGQWVQDKDEIGLLLWIIFQIYNGVYSPVIDLLESRILREDNERLVAPFCAKEFQRATFQMHSDKSQAGEMNPAFFPKVLAYYWGGYYRELQGLASIWVFSIVFERCYYCVNT